MLLDKRNLLIDKKYKEKISEIIMWYLEKIHNEVEANLIKQDDYEDFLITISNLLPIIPELKKDKYICVGYELAKKIKIKIESDNFRNFYSMFTEGLGYCAYSIYSFNRSTGLLSKFLNDINKLFLDESYKQAVKLIDNYKNNTNTFDYDIIYGLSGTLNYLFEFEWEETEVDKLKTICKYLVMLAEKSSQDEFIAPKIYIPYHNSTDDEKKCFLYGHINLSVSHGIAGPLKALAMAKNKGFNVEGLDNSISIFLNIYDKYEIEIDNAITWPPIIDLEEYCNNRLKNLDYYLDFYKWCYGSFSLSKILLETCSYLDDEEKSLKYNNNCKKIAKQHFNDFYLFTTNICHGYASILAMQLLAYKKDNDITLITNLEYSINNILNCFDKKNDFGFRINLDENFINEIKEYEIKSYNFLEGTTGIVLALSLVFNDDIDFNKLLFFD
ncbi:lanthionine synthetase LanC family protein [Metaclostridioides mangenotii]|uniref:Lanthionine synthetase C-like protein n=2 Tax=Metaclostridioides mangenotii TaxID=1540 RepID=A0ABS4E7X8_9FIRM|nr:lanthionine synthetase LanC family protein [Clostridioides mangenotii]MBP1854047.1 hypothetical protein [Clostridioides mangenotii]